jgi:hypothetical protein
VPIPPTVRKRIDFGDVPWTVATIVGAVIALLSVFAIHWRHPISFGAQVFVAIVFTGLLAAFFRFVIFLADYPRRSRGTPGSDTTSSTPREAAEQLTLPAGTTDGMWNRAQVMAWTVAVCISAAGVLPSALTAHYNPHHSTFRHVFPWVLSWVFGILLIRFSIFLADRLRKVRPAPESTTPSPPEPVM